MTLSSKPLTATLWPDFESFFEHKNSCSGCWCMNHRLPLGLDFEGEPAKLAMKQLIETNRVFGVLAYTENDPIPVGWCALDRRNTLPGHDCVGTDIKPSEDEWSIHCVTARSDFKKKGVENFLVEEATKLASELKARFVEGYPEPSSNEEDGFKTWNTFNGYESYFLENGFTKVEKDLGEAKEFYSVVKKSFES